MIEDWYRHHQTEDLSQFLCANHVLKGKDTSKSWLLPGAKMMWECLGGQGSLAKAWGSLPLHQSPLCPSLLFSLGCLAEKWTGKKGDLASVGKKQSKKKSGKKKKKGQKDEREGAASLPDTGEALEGVQEQAPLTHSPADEL